LVAQLGEGFQFLRTEPSPELEYTVKTGIFRLYPLRLKIRQEPSGRDTLLEPLPYPGYKGSM